MNYLLQVCTHVHTLTVAPSGTPKWLTVRCSLPTSVWLSWGTVPKDQQNGVITGYSIQLEGPDTTRSIQIATTVSDETSSDETSSDETSSLCSLFSGDDLLFSTVTEEEVSDLKPSTEYSFSVSAETVAGSGPAISVSFVTPQEGEASTHITHVVCGGMFSVCLLSKEHT